MLTTLRNFSASAHARREQERRLIAELLADPRLRQAIDATAAKSGEPRLNVERQAHQHLERITARYRHSVVKMLDPLFSLVLKRLYRRMEISGLDRLKSLNQEYQLIYLPAHRSHIDYMLISWALFQQGLPLPRIAAGENLNLPLVGALLKRGGAVFLRRSFLDDPLYTCLVRLYLEQLLSNEHSFEVFIEGQRSRTGRLLPPRLGLLSMLLESKTPRPLALLPISINYDLCLDNRTYQHELAGRPKRSESLWGVISSASVLFKRCGGAYLKVGEPVFIAENSDSNATLDTARQVMRRINQATIATEAARIASLLPGAKQNLPQAELEQAVADLSRLLQQQGTDLPRRDRAPGAMITAMSRRGQLSLSAGNVLVCEQQSAELSYYRNNLTHALVLPGLMILLAARLPKPGRSTITRLMRALQPYLAAEFTLEVDKDEPVRLRQTLLQLGLLREDKQQLHPHTNLLTRALFQLAETVLLRQYLLVRIITQQPQVKELQLCEITTALARHLQSWYEHPLPEYADQRQLRPLIECLEQQQLLNRNDQRLSAARDLTPILRVGRKLLPDVLIQESERWLAQH
ncbi:1-acyl-sn-glycerol-3-phosphate acyltransferase [Marinobacterium mangrovicola]|uniref:Glycerol-3-phosphate acyltransferase n=1 Tax=Marinobacterium mangrovicola TaxID=1476959 RepID=A0A4R1GFV7_9GAMM|nr:1-acyl-sn-glycerol-3-phosphate acyltransferase [Marinobacterium mangrovicola]TCK03112.1 glycerol-3-phosphate acyltransferase [Marinobacterium mangrovicola]